MANKTSEKDKLQVLYPQRTKRRHLPTVIRFLIIALWGVTLSFIVVYFLGKLGY